MKLLIAGLVIFIGIHLLPTFSGIRRGLITRLGEFPYKGLFALPALLGLVLIVIGLRQAEEIPVWSPPAWGYKVPYIIMPVVFIMLAAAYFPGNIKRFTRHPMLWGVVLWSGAHLLATGDLAVMILCISLALFALFDMASANRRGAVLSQTRLPWYRDIIIIIIGMLAYLGVLLVHPAASPLRTMG